MTADKYKNTDGQRKETNTQWGIKERVKYPKKNESQRVLGSHGG